MAARRRTLLGVLAVAAGWAAGGEELLIAQKPAAAPPPSAAEMGAALELLRKSAAGDAAAAATWQEMTLGTRAWALASAAQSGSQVEVLRRRATKELAEVEPAELDADAQRARLRALALVAVREPATDIRASAHDAWLRGARSGDRDALRPMAGAINREDPDERRRAFENLREVGGPGVLIVLITEVQWRWNAFPRGHILIGRQRSYISDYNISGDAYDPVVRQFITGMAHDVKVLEVLMIEYIVEQLRGFGAGEDIIRNPPEWLQFLRKLERAQLGLP